MRQFFPLNISVQSTKHFGILKSYTKMRQFLFVLTLLCGLCLTEGFLDLREYIENTVLI